MDKPEMRITYESVTFPDCEVAGNMLFRPKLMSVSQWMRFWENVQELGPIEVSRLREQMKDYREEIKELRGTIDDLYERIADLEAGE
jgi:hypothetical protein